MAIEQISFNGKAINLEIQAERSSFDGVLTKTDIQERIRAASCSYYIQRHGFLLFSKRSAISVESQILDWQELRSGEYIIVWPLDRSLYIAIVDIEAHYRSIHSEVIVSYDGLSKIKREHPQRSILMVEGGQLTEQLVSSGLAGVNPHFELSVSPAKEHHFKKMGESLFIGLTVMVLVFALLGYWLYSSWADKQARIKARKAKVIGEMPKGEEKLPEQLRLLANANDALRPLMAYQLKTFNYNGSTGSLSGGLRGNQFKIPRLMAIANSLSATYLSGPEDWQITGLPMTLKANSKERLKPINRSKQTLIEYGLNSRFRVVVGIPRTIVKEDRPVYKERTDTLITEGGLITSANIRDLATALDAMDMHAHITSATLTRRKAGGWHSLSITVTQRGS